MSERNKVSDVILQNEGCAYALYGLRRIGSCLCAPQCVESPLSVALAGVLTDTALRWTPGRNQS